MTAVATTSKTELTVSELINIHIPQTNDVGDAIGAAAAILSAAYRAVCREYGMHEYTFMTGRVQTYLAKQHLAFLKTGEVR